MSSILINGERIENIDASDAKGDNEVRIDDAGDTLVAGMYEIHAYTRDQSGLLNVLAGITSFIDMGNNYEVLDKLIEKIDSGVLAGTRIHRLGFIEGKRQYSANNGIIVSS